MKIFKLFMAVLCACAMISCGGDNDCVASDFVGTYTGTDCQGVILDAVVTDNEDGTINIELGEPTFSITYDDLMPDGCSVEILSIAFSGVTSSLRAELDGNDLVFFASSNDPDEEVCDETTLTK